MTALSRDDRKQLATILGCTTAELNRRLKAYQEAATEEYISMILGSKVFSRGQDILEWRLNLLIKHVFGGRLPSEQVISAHFQTSTTQSRALLRAVMSKYQYELHDGIRATLKGLIEKAKKAEDADTWLVTVDSENLVDALNRELASVNGALPHVGKLRGTVATYAIPASSYAALTQRFSA